MALGNYKKVIPVGKFGTDFFDTYINSSNQSRVEDCAYSGIYMGGYGTNAGTNTRDRSHRYMVVEGGLIANAIGGLKVTNNSNVNTKMYVKGGEIYNIIGGAGVSATYEDRIIQVTGGTIDYSISGGSNGYYAVEFDTDYWGNQTPSNNNGKLNGQTLVYIGGKATVGKSNTITKFANISLTISRKAIINN